MARSVLYRLYNPRNRTCGCSAECWCRRTTLGRAFRWWFPGRYFGMPHQGRLSRLEKRNLDALMRSARIVGVEPIFAVADLPRAVEHYARLGFEISHHDEGYAFAHRDGLTLHLDLTDAPPPGGGLLYLHVDDADRLADEWRAAGIEFVEPQDFEWGKHEGSHADPDGNVIRFGSPLRG